MQPGPGRKENKLQCDIWNNILDVTLVAVTVVSPIGITLTIFGILLLFTFLPIFIFFIIAPR